MANHRYTPTYLTRLDFTAVNTNLQDIQQALNDVLVRYPVSSNYMEDDIDMNSNGINNLADPVNDYDAAHKGYVDYLARGVADFADAAEQSALAATASAAAALASELASDLSETHAATSEANALASENAASSSSNSAAQSASSASASRSNAATSAVTASSKASSASQSATTATNAASSATNSASTAVSKAIEASSSATLAANSATAAQTAETNAKTIYDNFDDRYLGDRASDPAKDNDGNPLITGALYFNTTSGDMRAYDGSVWIAITHKSDVSSATGTLPIAHGGTGATTKAAARTGLGLGKAATKDTGTAAAEVPQNSDLGSAAYVDVGTGNSDVPQNSDLDLGAYAGLATTSRAGLVEQATTTEANAGTANKYPDAAAMQAAGDARYLGKTAKAVDANKLDGQDSAYYRNAGNLNAGNVPVAQLPSASTTAKGAAEIATQAETDATTDDSKIITPKKLWDWSKFVSGTTASTIAKRDNAGRIQAADPAANQDVATLAWAQREFSQPTVTGSATFTKLTNNIQLTNVVPNLSLQKGDVIEISTTALNDNLYTVESITDNNNIIVNYEHRNGAGSLSLTDETVSCTIKRIAKWYSAPPALGRAPVDLSGSRSPNVAYRNTTEREMQTSIRVASNKYGSYSADSVTWLDAANTGTSDSVQMQMSIPNGWYYKTTGGQVWLEVR